jgi:protein gp37
MGETSGIQWTDATWNPWTGCHKISPGCKFCYMYTDKKRYGQDPSVVRRSKTTFNDPLKWKEPRKVFTCSWSDWFIEEADGWRDEAWEVIKRTPQHTYQILTKRPERISGHLPADWGWGYPNVWLGTSIENQETASRVMPLSQVNCVVRFLSIEPLLGPLDLGFGYARIDWLIVGGESGPGARAMKREWIDRILYDAKLTDVPVFVKQLGAAFSDEVNGIAGKSLKIPSEAVPLFSRRLKDPKGGDWTEWPEQLRIREFPEAR